MSDFFFVRYIAFLACLLCQKPFAFVRCHLIQAAKRPKEDPSSRKWPYFVAIRTKSAEKLEGLEKLPRIQENVDNVLLLIFRVKLRCLRIVDVYWIK